MTTLWRFVVLGGLSLSGCGGDPDPRDGGARETGIAPIVCGRERHAAVQFEIDGESGSFCGNPIAHGEIRTVDRGRPREQVAVGGATQCGAPSANFGSELLLYNIDLVNGTNGVLVREDGRETRPYPEHLENWTTPYVELRLIVGPDGTGCESELARFAVGGTWRVIRGETIDGGSLELEVRDAVFDPIEGHTYRFPRIYWNTSLVGPINMDPPDRPPAE